MVDELATIVVVLLPSPIKKHGCAEPFRELRATSSSPKQTLLDLFCIVKVVIKIIYPKYCKKLYECSGKENEFHVI